MKAHRTLFGGIPLQRSMRVFPVGNALPELALNSFILVTPQHIERFVQLSERVEHEGLLVGDKPALDLDIVATIHTKVRRVHMLTTIGHLNLKTLCLIGELAAKMLEVAGVIGFPARPDSEPQILPESTDPSWCLCGSYLSRTAEGTCCITTGCAESVSPNIPRLRSNLSTTARTVVGGPAFPYLPKASVRANLLVYSSHGPSADRTRFQRETFGGFLALGGTCHRAIQAVSTSPNPERLSALLANQIGKTSRSMIAGGRAILWRVFDSIRRKIRLTENTCPCVPHTLIIPALAGNNNLCYSGGRY